MEKLVLPSFTNDFEFEQNWFLVNIDDGLRVYIELDFSLFVIEKISVWKIFAKEICHFEAFSSYQKIFRIELMLDNFFNFLASFIIIQYFCYVLFVPYKIDSKLKFRWLTFEILSCIMSGFCVRHFLEKFQTIIEIICGSLLPILGFSF